MPADLPANVTPAHKVGGMRVKQPEHHVPLKDTHKEDEHDEEQTSEDKKEEERLRVRELQERQAQDMYAHTAARQASAPKSSADNLRKQQVCNPATQPRAMNH
ncbi:hypothetical protein BDF20DRAFT_860807 [Mycotypha africana]|uniref:uncharacterized protein n=1 Tax=Mycotypha africana TaxID=64632 RepID=UPI0023010BDF|nr:uncharacterized protein BDF20DRAFT_860807 [Mycotypha africana]KAI8984599.1 hypothetical protein BDF20DRAFT_860807 [Mycotypha africana]